MDLSCLDRASWRFRGVVNFQEMRSLQSWVDTWAARQPSQHRTDFVREVKQMLAGVLLEVEAEAGKVAILGPDQVSPYRTALSHIIQKIEDLQ